MKESQPKQYISKGGTRICNSILGHNHTIFVQGLSHTVEGIRKYLNSIIQSWELITIIPFQWRPRKLLCVPQTVNENCLSSIKLEAQDRAVSTSKYLLPLHQRNNYFYHILFPSIINNFVKQQISNITQDIPNGRSHCSTFCNKKGKADFLKKGEPWRNSTQCRCRRYHCW